MVGPENNVQNKSSQRAQNSTFRLVFATAAFSLESHNANLFHRTRRKCVRHPLYLEPTMGPEKIFKIEVLIWLENAILRLVLQIQYFLREQCY